MSLLLDLPDDLSRLVLMEWLCFESLPFLDSAMSSSALRTRHVRVLQNVDGKCNSPKLNILKWINARNMRLTVLNQTEPVSKAWFQTFKSQWTNITTLSLNSAQSLEDMKACSRLTSLTCVATISSLDSCVLANLKRLSIQRCTIDSMSDLREIREHCRQLQSLDFVFPLPDEITPILLDILKLNNQLKSVCLFVNEVIFAGLSAHCPSLVSLVAHIRYFDADVFSRIFQRFVSIEHAQINWNDCQISCSKERTELSWCTNISYTSTMPENSKERRLYMSRDMYRDTPLLESVLQQCASLRKFAYSGFHNIEFNRLLKEHPIEDLTILGPNKRCEDILADCRHLKRFTFSQKIMPYEALAALVDAIKSYRHIETGLPLVGEFDFALRDGKFGNVYQIQFDGSTFSVRDWVSKAYFTKADNSESIVDFIKSHEKKCSKTKRRQIVTLHLLC